MLSCAQRARLGTFRIGSAEGPLPAGACRRRAPGLAGVARPNAGRLARRTVLPVCFAATGHGVPLLCNNCPQGSSRMAVHHRRGGGCPPPPPPDPLDQSDHSRKKVGKNEIYHWENLLVPVLVHKLLGSRPPPSPFRSGKGTERREREGGAQGREQERKRGREWERDPQSTSRGLTGAKGGWWVRADRGVWDAKAAQSSIMVK